MKLSRTDGINVRFGLLVLSFTILNRIAAISEGSIKESSRLPQFSSFSHHTAYTKFDQICIVASYDLSPHSCDQRMCLLSAR